MRTNRPRGAESPDEDLSPDVELELEILEARPGTLPAGERAGAGARTRRIVLVDDDPALRAYARRCLERMFGRTAEVVEADDGEEALGLAKDGGADLIVCEFFLPRLGGLELVARLRAERALAATPILLTAGGSLLRAERRRVEDMADIALLDKPFNARKLRVAVERLLG